MEWTSDPAGARYTARQGSCQGYVWRAAGGWAAAVHHPESAVGRDSFATPTKAHVWCEERLSALATAGRCTDA